MPTSRSAARGRAAAERPGPWRPVLRSERDWLGWLVGAIALHSVAVGAVLLLAPAWSARFGGWGETQPLFFVRQFGVFHFAIAAAYLVEYLRYRGVVILLAAKTIAVVSLLWALVRDGGPWAVVLAAAGDAAMALTVLGLLAWRARGATDPPAVAAR